MAGCRSCSGCAPSMNYSPSRQAEKLEKRQLSGNPRYPHVFVGKQAIYTDENAQIIVTVLEDDCDEQRDAFKLTPQRVLKDKLSRFSSQEPFQVAQAAGGKEWKLHALI